MKSKMEKYWDNVLSGLGLSMNRGKPKNINFIGNGFNITGKEEEISRKKSGRVIPEGRGPDKYQN